METNSTKLSNLQLELLKHFNQNVSEEDLKNIRSIIKKYFADKITNRFDKIWDEKGWSNETMENFLKEDMRKRDHN